MKFSIDVGMILIFAAAASTFAKPLVDVLKKTPLPTPPWSLPILAIAIGIVVCFLLTLMAGNELTIQSAAASILAGISAGIGAVASTELQRSAEASSK